MIGLTPEEAVKRLSERGAVCEVQRHTPRKRVLGKTEPRVMRVRENGPAVELLVGDFRVFDIESEEHH